MQGREKPQGPFPTELTGRCGKHPTTNKKLTSVFTARSSVSPEMEVKRVHR